MTFSRLLKFTFTKINYKVTRRYAAVLGFLVAVLIFLSYTVRASSEPITGSPSSMFTSDPVANFSIYINALHFLTILFLIVFMSNHITRDHDHGIEKKHIADGMTASEVFSSRLILIAGIAVTITLVIFILLIAEGMFFKHNHAGSFFTIPVLRLLLFVLSSIIYYLTIAAALASVLRNTAYVMLVMIVVFIGEETFIRYSSLTELSAVIPYLPVTGFYRLITDGSIRSAMCSLIIFNLAIAVGMALQNRKYAIQNKPLRSYPS